MRIISGKNRGIKLISPESYDVRPTLDRVKQAIFNVIQFDISGARVLDLFAGTGALGIEAVSRGATETVFNDSSPASCELIRENCKKINHSPQLYSYDYAALLERFHIENKKFDIIFIDPPYAGSLGTDSVNLIIKYGLLNNGGVIIYEHSDEKNIVLPADKYSIKSKKYGIVNVDFIYCTIA